MSKKNVYLSAGHSGENEYGATTTWFNEKYQCRYMVNAIAEKIGEKSYLRCSEPNLCLKDRIAAANVFCGIGSGVAVEIHFNAGGGGKASGCETIIADNASQTSKQMAFDLVKIVSDILKIRNRGVKTEAQTARKHIAFVSHTTCPAVILEVCFLDNEDDVEKFAKHQTELIKALAEYFDKL